LFKDTNPPNLETHVYPWHYIKDRIKFKMPEVFALNIWRKMKRKRGIKELLHFEGMGLASSLVVLCPITKARRSYIKTKFFWVLTDPLLSASHLLVHRSLLSTVSYRSSYQPESCPRWPSQSCNTYFNTYYYKKCSDKSILPLKNI
jgi:hypothetical protein